MKITDVKKKATNLGIKSVKMKKTDLIRTIQLKEGNSPCFQTGITSCDQNECCCVGDPIVSSDPTGRNNNAAR